MKFLQPTPPPYVPLEWTRKPLAERARGGRIVCEAWASQGYGTPLAVYVDLRPWSLAETMAHADTALEMGVPIEWNFMVAHGAFALFCAHPDVTPLALGNLPLSLFAVVSLHGLQLLSTNQAPCGFEPGELRGIFVESPPLGVSALAFEIRDASAGVMQTGQLEVAGLRARQPWAADVA